MSQTADTGAGNMMQQEGVKAANKIQNEVELNLYVWNTGYQANISGNKWLFNIKHQRRVEYPQPVMGDFAKFEAHLNFVYKSKGLRLDVFLFVYKDTKLYSYQFML